MPTQTKILDSTLVLNHGTPQFYTKCGSNWKRVHPLALTSAFEKKRTVCHLQGALYEPALEKALTQLGFQAKETLSTLYAYLGKGDLIQGKTAFEALGIDGKIALERVGRKSEDNSGKFYLVLKVPVGSGSTHLAYFAVSPKGTDRIEIEEIKGKEHQTEDTGYDVLLSKKLKNYPTSRTMNHEPGVKIGTRGEEDLYVYFKNQRPPKEIRLLIYANMLEGLAGLHELGFVHGDEKPQNNVVTRKNGAVNGSLLIDLHNLKPIQDPKQSIVCSLGYLSPERLRGLDKLPNPKDDVWGAMYSICELEGLIPKEDCLLSNAMIERFKLYHQLQIKMARQQITPQAMFSTLGIQPYTDATLFGSTPHHKDSFDGIIVAMAHMHPGRRLSAASALQAIRQYKSPSAIAVRNPQEEVAIQKDIGLALQAYRTHRSEFFDLQDAIDKVLDELQSAIRSQPKERINLSYPKEIEHTVQQNLKLAHARIDKHLNRAQELHARVQALPPSPKKEEMRETCITLLRTLGQRKKELEKAAATLQDIQAHRTT